MSGTDDAVHCKTVTSQVPVGIRDRVPDRYLLGADGGSDEVAPSKQEYVDVEAVRRSSVPVLATSYRVLGAKGCLQELLCLRRKVPKLAGVLRRQADITRLRQGRALLRCRPRRGSVVPPRSVLDRN